MIGRSSKHSRHLTTTTWVQLVRDFAAASWVRFVLDYDVDIRICQLLSEAGHKCWRAPEGLIEDDDVSV